MRQMQYVPADVERLAEMQLVDVRAIAAARKATGLPQEEVAAAGKTPTDVFAESVAFFVKLRALMGEENISPDIVFAELTRAAADLHSILMHIDPACRYRVDAPATRESKTPKDVFAQCLEIRRQINAVCQYLNLEATPVPAARADRQIQPSDVFV